jgi:hypothetical protein
MILAYALEFACICWVGFNPENPGLVLHCQSHARFRKTRLPLVKSFSELTSVTSCHERCGAYSTTVWYAGMIFLCKTNCQINSNTSQQYLGLGDVLKNVCKMGLS